MPPKNLRNCKSDLLQEMNKGACSGGPSQHLPRNGVRPHNPGMQERPEGETTEIPGARVHDHKRLLILIAGAAFVLVSNSEALHAALRTTLGIGGVQCC